MNVILGRAELLMRKSKDESTKRGLETIVTQVERITKIMNQLLSFARMRPSEQRGVDMVGQNRWKMCSICCRRNSKATIFTLSKTYSQPDLPHVLADSDHMSQVLLNLILNACQAMPEGGTLTLTASHKGRHDRTQGARYWAWHSLKIRYQKFSILSLPPSLLEKVQD